MKIEDKTVLTITEKTKYELDFKIHSNSKEEAYKLVTRINEVLYEFGKEVKPDRDFVGSSYIEE